MYGIVAPSEEVERPVGEWNTTRIVCRGSKAEHWLNGKKVVQYDTSGPEWQDLKDKSEIKSGKERIGTQDRGHILLQSQTGELAFRSVRVREWSPSATAPASTKNESTDLDKVATGEWKPLVTDKTPLPEPKQMKWKDGVLELNRSVLPFPEIEARNIAVRAQIRKTEKEGGDIQLRARACP